MSESVHHSDEIVRLDRARERVADVERRIDEHGEGAVETVSDAYRRATDLLDRYVDRATGTGKENFKAYLELEGQFDALVENLPDDVPRREAFEEASDAIDKRRLSERDFERAETALEPAAELAELFDEREAAGERLDAARKDARRRLREVDDEIDDRERLLELATVDLDAPVDRLRGPIESYNERVREAFEAYRLEESAREVFDFLERARWYPLVGVDRPPAELREYVDENPAGEYTVPELLRYADYSRSKLSHYVDDPDELKRRVATRQTYLDGIEADPLTIEWPPKPREELRFRIRELIPLVSRLADEAVVAALREVRSTTEDPEYDRLRTAADARTRLDEAERRRLADGRVEDELAELRAERDRLREALERGD